MERQTRSEKYQYVILETTFSDELLSMFDNSQGISGHLNPFEYDEEVLELKDQLYARLWKLIDIHCTPLQKEILELLYKDGYTQVEVAKMRKVNQSSVVKCVLGNCDYSKPEKKHYGGSVPKLRRVLMEDAKFVELWDKIKDKQQPRY